MSSIEDYSGLCGCIHLSSSSDQRVRCKYEFGHHGPHSWANKTVGLTIFAGSIARISISSEEGFERSVLSSLRFNHGLIYIDDEDSIHVRK